MKEKDLKTNFTKICGVAYHLKDIKNIIRFCEKHSYKWYYITHRDLDENSNEKKLHYHFIIESNTNHRFSICSLVCDTLTINLFQKLDNVKNYLRYMTHIDYDNKKHYHNRLIKSNVSIEEIEKLINNVGFSKQDETDNNFKLILNYILDMQLNFGMLLKFSDIIQYCLKNDIQYKSSWSFTIKCLLQDFSNN